MGRQKSNISFIAVPLPDSLKEAIGKFQDQSKNQNLPLFWELPQKLHITLNYLGKIDDAALHKLKTSLTPVVASVDPFELELTHLDYYYKRHGDSILMLRLKDVTKIKNLEKTLRPVLFEAGFSPPLRFDPHLTIARLKRLRHPNQVKQLLIQASEFQLPALAPFAVTEIHFLQSLHWQNASSTAYRLKGVVKLGIAATEE